MKCHKCQVPLDAASAQWFTADGSRRRKHPLCKDCHEDTVRGVGRVSARTNRWCGKLQRPDGEAQRKYDG